jgi:hypothetical protein
MRGSELRERLKMSIKIIADHESAHCFIYYFNGFKIEHVRICVDPLRTFQEPQGFCYATSSRPAVSAAQIYCTMAGTVQDEINAVKYPTQKYGPSVADLNAIKGDFRLCRETMAMHEYFRDHPTADITEFIHAFQKPVLNLLRSRRGSRAVAALSSELMKITALTGAEAVSIIEKAYGQPLPPMALPASRHGISFTNKVTNLDELLSRLRLYAYGMDMELETLDGTLVDWENEFMTRLKGCLLQLQFAMSEKVVNP